MLLLLLLLLLLRAFPGLPRTFRTFRTFQRARTRHGRDGARGMSADALLKEAEAALKTGLFNWTPDYLLAGPKFEQAAQQLRATGRVEEAVKAYERAAECHVKPGAAGWEAAARCVENAGRALAHAGQQDKAAGMYVREAGVYMENGVPERAMEALGRAAQACEVAGNGDKALQHLARAAELLPTDEDAQVQARFVVRGLEILRALVNKYTKLGNFPEAIKAAVRARDMMLRNKQTTSAYKMTLALIVLYIARGDTAAAQKLLNEAFDDSAFLRTDEAAAAEDLVKAYAAMDSEAVKKAGASRACSSIEREVAYLARQLDPLKRLGAQPAPAPASAVAAAAPTEPLPAADAKKASLFAPAAGKGGAAKSASAATPAAAVPAPPPQPQPQPQESTNPFDALMPTHDAGVTADDDVPDLR